MYKRIFATALTMVMLLASIGFAANMQVTASAVPVSGGTIKPTGIKFYAPSPTAFANYSVVAKPGWALTDVKVDGVVTGAAGTNYYQVSRNLSTSVVHTIKATFAQTLYSITTTAGAGGSISVTGGGTVNITPGSNRGYTVAPGVGSQIDTLTVDGGSITPTPLNSAGAYTGNFTNIQVSHTVAATFKTATSVNAGADQTLPALTTTVTGTISNGSIATWSYTGPVGATFGTPTALTSTFTAVTPGNYIITLTATNGYSDSAALALGTADNTNPCYTHAGAVVTNFNASGHKSNAHGPQTCDGCHVGASAVHPGTPTGCAGCHGPTVIHPAAASNCQVCHTTSAASPDAHAKEDGCIDCHATARNAGAGFVQDNNGVRSITQEFTKWSHHVTGVDLNNSHCAACHLAGKQTAYGVHTDANYHMADNKIHLRNADTDADFVWDPATPNHSNMDNFCMSCHDANGATSTGSVAIQGFINTNGLAAAGKTASAKNPFGDTISNRYDKMQRPGVVNVDSQFDTTNNSHHGVKGPRYSGRTRAAGPRQIASPTTFANNSTTTLWGKRSTIYDGVDAITGVTGGPKEAFNALYVPLANAGGETAPRTGAQSLGDDSTLHCGDCHTVGQWKPGTAQGYTATDPATIIPGTSPAIGAHGSNNEYMLRNSKGIDERHTQDAYTVVAGVNILKNPNAAFLVCFNCHSYERYGSVFAATGTTGPHAGEYDAAGRCNGIGNNIPFNGYTTGKATDGTQFAPRMGLLKQTITASTVIYGRTYTASSYPAVVTINSLEGLAQTPAFAPGFPLNYANAPGGVQAATYVGEQTADFGNVFGIQCLNCHNSGVGNGYGGIHGSANDTEGTANTGAPTAAAPAGGAFVNGMGNWSKVERFLPGLGNVMHVPGTLGGVTGGTTYGPITNSTFVYSFQTGGVMNDTNWEQVAWQQVDGKPVTVTARAGAGCYTLPIGNAASPNAPTFGLEGLPVGGEGSLPVEAEEAWGSCDDHQGAPAAGGTKGGGDHGFIKRINRPITY